MALKKIDTKKALEMRLKGSTMKEIGEKFGVSKAAASQHLKPLLTQLCRPEQLEEYQEKQADILDALSAGILGSISKANLTKATLQQKVSSVSLLVDKSRLIRGQSTNNSVSILLARHVHELVVTPSTLPVITIEGEI